MPNQRPTDKGTETCPDLYGAPNPAPNPRRVRIFLAEKGIDLPETRIDLMQREHKSPEHRARNFCPKCGSLRIEEGAEITCYD